MKMEKYIGHSVKKQLGSANAIHAGLEIGQNNEHYSPASNSKNREITERTARLTIDRTDSTITAFKFALYALIAHFEENPGRDSQLYGTSFFTPFPGINCGVKRISRFGMAFLCSIRSIISSARRFPIGQGDIVTLLGCT